MKTARTGVLAGTTLALATGASAQEVLTFSHWVPTGHAMHSTGIEPWAESIAEASNGELQVDIYPAQQLGAAPDHYDMARDGIADITHINPGYQPGRFPIIALGELPFHVTNAKAGTRAVDEWYREYAEEEMSDVYFCMAIVHDPGTFHSKTPIHVPGDVSGLNVRPAHATMGRFVNMLGGSSVQVSAPEAREVLERGAADAITFPWDGLYLFGMDEVVDHHLDLPLYVTTFVNVMNQARYDSLSPENQQVIDDHCTSEWAERMASGWADVEAAGRVRMIESDEHEVYEPTEDEAQAWRDAAAPLLESWKQDVRDAGGDPDAIYEHYRDTLAQHDSLME